MENTEKVGGKIIWKQESETKVGQIVETISTKDSKIITDIAVNGKIVSGMKFQDEKNAFIWLYGVKQFLNDKVAGNYRDWETDRKSTRLNSSHRL